MRKSLLWALLVSVLLHLAALALPHIKPQASETLPAHFDAVLLPPPPPPAAPQPTPVPPPVAQRAPHHVATTDSLIKQTRQDQSVPAPAVAQPASAPATPPAPPPPPPPPPSADNTTHRSLPARLDLTYDLIKGTQGLIVGRVTHHLALDGDRYRFSSTAEATGLFSLFQSGQLTQTSRGRITAAGLQPDYFSTKRGGHALEEAHFDWEHGQLLYGSTDQPPQTAPLQPGSLDFLSFLYQFALTAQPDKQFSFYMTNGRGFLRQEYEATTIEDVDTPLGPQKALLLRRTGGDGKEKVDIWLGVAQHYLPLRIRFTDKNGEVAEERLRILRQPDKTEQTDTNPAASQTAAQK